MRPLPYESLLLVPVKASHKRIQSCPRPALASWQVSLQPVVRTALVAMHVSLVRAPSALPSARWCLQQFSQGNRDSFCCIFHTRIRILGFLTSVLQAAKELKLYPSRCYWPLHLLSPYSPFCHPHFISHFSHFWGLFFTSQCFLELAQ